MSRNSDAKAAKADAKAAKRAEKDEKWAALGRRTARASLITLGQDPRPVRHWGK